MKTVLVFAAHPDDELLGEGGTVRKLANQGINCHAVILGEGLTSRKSSRTDTQKDELEELKSDARNAALKVGYTSIDFCDLPDNRFDSMDLLDIIKVVSEYIEKYDPDTIFTHHSGDLNIDHRCSYQAVITACRPVNGCKVKRIYTFETPSATEWNFAYDGNQFTPNVFVDVTDTVQAKIDGMACYRSESTVYPHPRSPEALLALASYRGSISGMNKAEAFCLVRELID